MELALDDRLRLVLETLSETLRTDRPPRAVLRDVAGLTCTLLDGEAAAITLLHDDEELGTVVAGPKPEAASPREWSPALRAPIVARGLAVGELTVLGHFSGEDAALLRLIGSLAGSALHNSQMLREALLARRWLRAAASLTADLADEDPEFALRALSMELADLADAEVALLLWVRGDQMTVSHVSHGAAAPVLAGRSYSRSSSPWTDRVITTGETEIVLQTPEPERSTLRELVGMDLGPSMLLPLRGAETVHGALFVGRVRGRARFTDTDREIATSFADHAGVVLEVSAARAAAERARILEDRHRIARDLHDHVIQRLYASGMHLRQVAGGLDPDRQERLASVLAQLDDSIEQIRSTITEDRPESGDGPSLAQLVAAIARDAEPLLGFAPTTRLEPAAAEISGQLAADLSACVREAVSNGLRHAHPHHLLIEAALDGEDLVMTVADDGVGLGHDPGAHDPSVGQAADRRSGLFNLARRAELRGGTFEVESPRDGGTTLRWRIPVPRGPRRDPD